MADTVVVDVVTEVVNITSILVHKTRQCILQYRATARIVFDLRSYRGGDGIECCHELGFIVCERAVVVAY